MDTQIAHTRAHTQRQQRAHTHTHTPWELYSSLATDRPRGSVTPSLTCSVEKEQNKEKERVSVLFSFHLCYKALWEPGQRCGQRWTQECHKHSQGKVTIMTSEACTHKHPCIHTHMEWKKLSTATKGIYLLACLWCGLSSLDRKLNCSILGMSLAAAQAWL